jgi:outer membrane protein assembly factor BamB
MHLHLSRLFALAIAFEILMSFSSKAAPALRERDTSTPFIEWAITGDFVSNEAHDALFTRDVVIVGTDKGDLRAYRNSNGKLVWTNEHGKRIFHGPCSDGERVYFASESGLTAVSIKDASPLWNFANAICDGPTHVLRQVEMAVCNRPG